MDDLSRLPPEVFSKCAAELLAEACPDEASRTFFERNMALASAQGLSWVQGLQFVIGQRHGLN